MGYLRYLETAAKAYKPAEFVWFKYTADRGVSVPFDHGKEALRKGDRFGALEIERGVNKDKMRLVFERLGLQTITYVSLDAGDKLLDRSRKIKTPTRLAEPEPPAVPKTPKAKPTVPEKPAKPVKPVREPAPTPKPRGDHGLTSNEAAVLLSIYTNEYIDGPLEKGGLVWSGSIDASDYPSGVPSTALPGVVSSLSKKGFATSSGGRSKDATVELTQAGLKLGAELLKTKQAEKKTPPTRPAAVPTTVYPLDVVQAVANWPNYLGFSPDSIAEDYDTLRNFVNTVEGEGRFSGTKGPFYRYVTVDNDEIRKLRADNSVVTEPSVKWYHSVDDARFAYLATKFPPTHFKTFALVKLNPTMGASLDFRALTKDPKWKRSVDYWRGQGASRVPLQQQPSDGVIIRFATFSRGDVLDTINFELEPSVETPKPTPAPIPTPQGRTARNVGSTDNKITDMNPGVAWTATKTKDGMLAYMAALWRFYNIEKFDSKMKLPNFRFLREQAAGKMRVRAHWTRSQRMIAVSPRLFNGPQPKFNEIFLHEMCHQAVGEITKLTYREPRGGHGPVWEGWMRKVGLEPARYDDSGNELYMDEEEIRAKEMRNKRNASVTSELVRIAPKPGVPAQYLDEKSGTMVKGYIVKLHDAKGRWLFIKGGPRAPITREWHYIPANWFYAIPEPDRDNYFGAEWQAAAQTVINSLHENKTRRSAKRTKINDWRNVLGF